MEGYQSQSIISDIINAVATKSGANKFEIEPLYYAIDNSVFSALTHPDGPPCDLEFTYAGCDVTVTEAGEVQVSK